MNWCSDENDQDDDFNASNNNNTNNRQPRGQEQRRQQTSPSVRRSQSNQERNEEKVDGETLDAIVKVVNSNEYCVLREVRRIQWTLHKTQKFERHYLFFSKNKKYRKRVLLICTTVKCVRLFVVKVYSVDCAPKNMNEIEILKALGNHPNIVNILQPHSWRVCRRPPNFEHRFNINSVEQVVRHSWYKIFMNTMKNGTAATTTQTNFRWCSQSSKR
jgi:hypothetical protein